MAANHNHRNCGRRGSLPGPVETASSRELDGLSPSTGVFQNDAAPVIVDNSPFLDLVQGSKAAEADRVIVQAAITYARGLSRAVGITH
jgi:hypothetical protein